MGLAGTEEIKVLLDPKFEFEFEPQIITLYVQSSPLFAE